MFHSTDSRDMFWTPPTDELTFVTPQEWKTMICTSDCQVLGRLAPKGPNCEGGRKPQGNNLISAVNGPCVCKTSYMDNDILPQWWRVLSIWWCQGAQRKHQHQDALLAHEPNSFQDVLMTPLSTGFYQPENKKEKENGFERQHTGWMIQCSFT